MKKLLLILLIILLPVVGYFSYALVNGARSCRQSVSSSLNELTVAKKLCEKQLATEYRSMKKCTEKMKGALLEDRAFMLNYFADKVRSSTAVRSVAKRYGTLFDFTHVALSDEAGYQFSRYGNSLTAGAKKPVITENGFRLAISDTLKESGSRIFITVENELLFSSLNEFADLLAVDILVMDKSKVVYTTLDSDVQNFGQKENGTVILNNEIYQEEHLQVSEQVVLYCLKK